MYLADVVRVFRPAGSVVATLVALAGAAAAHGAGADVSGVWIDHTGQGAVEIGPCGNIGGNPADNRVCGRVVWLKNPDHRSRSGKRICGTQVLGDLRREAANAWDSGWIYNPEDEERFSASLQLANADTLKVTGYLGVKFLGETFTWKRATTSLERCAPGGGTHAGTH
jgi:uncharacterized protein (DUF2147 family)